MAENVVSWVPDVLSKFDQPALEVSTFLKEIQDNASQEVIDHLENILKDSESTCPAICDRINEQHFLTDLMQDIQHFNNYTCDEIELMDQMYGCSHASYYPRLGMTGASVCVFPNRTINDKVAAFIYNTSQAYRNTQRIPTTQDSSGSGNSSSSSTGLHFRISIISSEEHSTGAPQVQPMDFASEFEYWSFLKAVTQAVMHSQETRSRVKNDGNEGGGNDSYYWAGKGMIPAGSSESDRTKDIAKFFSGSSDYIIEIASDVLMAHAGTETVFRVPLENLIALALSCDWPIPQDYVLEIDIQENVGSASHSSVRSGFNLALLNRDLEVQRNPQYYQKLVRNHAEKHDEDDSRIAETSTEVTRVLIPLSKDNLGLEQTPNGLFSVAIIKGNFEVSVDGTGNTDIGASRVNLSGNMDDVAAIDPIPFALFKVPLDISNSNGQINAVVGEKANTANFSPILNHPTVHIVRISADPSHRAVEVHIIGAVDLPTLPNGNDPSCYCAVYLVDSQGDKINARRNGVSRLFKTSEEGEWKTDIIKSRTNPMWDTKLLLQEDGDVGIDSVAYIRVVVKTAPTSIFSKPTHFGQVTIPIGCFIEDVDVPLTLPLESSSRSTTDINEIMGTLHVIVKAVRIKAGGESVTSTTTAHAVPSTRRTSASASVIKPINRARSSSIAKEDAPDHIPLQYTLKPGVINALNTFWPFIVLGGSIGTSSGYISMGSSSLILNMSPGSGGVLANCEEKKNFASKRAEYLHSLSAGSAYASDTYFTIDWNNVEDAMPLTSSVMVLRINVHKQKMEVVKPTGRNLLGLSMKLTASAPSKSTMSSSQQQLVSVEILIAPCPSKKLFDGFHERKKFYQISNNMRDLHTRANDYKEYTGKRSYHSADEILTNSRKLVNKLEKCVEEHSLYDFKTSLNSSLVNIEESSSSYNQSNRWTKRVERDRGGVKRKSLDATASAQSLAGLQMAIEVNSIVIAACRDEKSIALLYARTKIRALAYRIKLLDVFKGFSKLPVANMATRESHGQGGSGSGSGNHDSSGDSASSIVISGSGNDVDLVPVYTISAVHGVVSRDCVKMLSSASLFSSNLAAELFELHSMIMKIARKRVLDYVLCSGDAETPSTARECLRELIGGYFSFLREQFEQYLGSPVAFKRTPGQEAKIMLLQMVVFCDEGLDVLVRKSLSCLQGKLSPALTLLDARYTPHDVIQWYNSSLQTETAQWLSKTIKQSAQFKNNTNNLPWDYEENGEYVISSLPETVMKQNHSFLELCDYTATKFAFASASLFPMKYASDTAYESEVDKLRDNISYVMRESSNRCLLLLAEEYQNALQIKNWSKANTPHSPTAVEYNLAQDKQVDEEANFMFLLSIANDCGRVVDEYTKLLEEAQERDKDENHSNIPSIKEVIKKFQSTANTVNLEIFRVIFADVHDLMIDFRNNWENQATLVVKKLVHNAESYFVETRKRLMHMHNHECIVGYSANAITGCFLMMIKSRANQDKKFVGGEFARFRTDINDVKRKFSTFLHGKAQLGHGRASVSEFEADREPLKPFSLLEDIADIMSTPFTSGPKAKDETLSKLILAVTFTYPRSVCDGVLKDSVYMRASLDHEILQILGDALRSDASKARFDNFVLPEDVTSHDRAFYKLCNKIYERNSTPGSKTDTDFFKGLRVGLSDAFSSSTNENDKKAKMENSKFLKILNVVDLDSEDRLSEMKTSREHRLSVSMGEGQDNRSTKSDHSEIITLVISRMEVRGVISSSYFSEANPYLAITVGSQRVKSEVQWNAKNGKADWGKEILTIPLSRSQLSSDLMEIEVNDKERLRRKRFIGKVTVKLGGLDLHRTENWFALKGGEYDGAEVFLSVDIREREE